MRPKKIVLVILIFSVISTSLLWSDQISPFHVVQKSFDERFLLMDWPLHLGFNNMRYVMEASLQFAKTLDRTLLIPSTLTIRMCLDEALCDEIAIREENLPCFNNGCTYRLSIHHFWDIDHLNSTHPVQIIDEWEKSPHQVEPIHDFKEFLIVEDYIIVDKRQDLRSDHMLYGHPVIHPEFLFLYHFERTLSWWDAWWNVRGFYEKFNSDAETLHVVNDFHFLERHYPFLFTTPEARDEFDAIVHSDLRYSSSVFQASDFILERLRLNYPGVEVGVHLRRNDFALLKWTTNDLVDLKHRVTRAVERTEEYIRRKCTAGGEDSPPPPPPTALMVGIFRIPIPTDSTPDTTPTSTLKTNSTSLPLPSSRFFVATDDISHEWLKLLDEWGGIPLQQFLHDREFKQMFGPLAAFGDWFGLVEQVVLAKLPGFSGTELSSYTGGVLNLRHRFNSCDMCSVWGSLNTW